MLPALFAVSAAMHVAGGVLGFMSHKDRAKQLRQIGESNARMAEAAAADAMTKMMYAESQARMKGSFVIGQQKVAYAGAGVLLGVGSPAGAEAQTRAMSELDAMVISNNAMREAYGFRMKARTTRLDAASAADSEEMAALGSLLGATGSLASLGIQTGWFSKAAAPDATTAREEIASGS